MERNTSHPGSFSVLTSFLSTMCILVICLSPAYAQEPEKPNIIVFLADDMGYSDIGCFGAEVETPNLDKLAKKGLRFSQFYNTGRCCPSRASLLTGLYPHMAGMGWMTGVDMVAPGYRGDLNKQCVTVAEVLKTVDYATYAAGKWHVSENVKYYGSKHNWPLQRGFDQYYGIIPGAANYFDPVGLTWGNDPIEAGDDFYFSDAISDTVVNYIRRHTAKNNNSPFFMYVAYNAPHWPLHAKEKDIKKYLEVYSKGWDELREERHERQRELGIIEKNVKLTQRDPKVPAWDSIPESDRKLWAKRMAVYAAQIDCMDQGIGRIIDALKQTNVFDNTLIIFISDNGAAAEFINRENKSLEALGTGESYQSYRINWANVSNTPFRLYKHWVHEGGIASPCVVSWPDMIEAKGEIVDTPVHLIDLMPTFVELAGADYPHTYKGHDIAPLPGKSMVPLFHGGGFEERPIFWEHEANRAVRLGKWKLVSKGTARAPYTTPWQLYNMATDRSETTDLAEKYPQKVDELAMLWHEWAEANRVFPLNGTNIPTRFKTFGRKKNGYH